MVITEKKPTKSNGNTFYDKNIRRKINAETDDRCAGRFVHHVATANKLLQ